MRSKLLASILGLLMVAPVFAYEPPDPYSKQIKEDVSSFTADVTSFIRDSKISSDSRLRRVSDMLIDEYRQKLQAECFLEAYIAGVREAIEAMPPAMRDTPADMIGCGVPKFLVQQLLNGAALVKTKREVQGAEWNHEYVVTLSVKLDYPEWRAIKTSEGALKALNAHPNELIYQGGEVNGK